MAAVQCTMAVHCNHCSPDEVLGIVAAMSLLDHNLAIVRSCPFLYLCPSSLGNWARCAPAVR
eukprot:5456890-Amphidinium_carterae.1